MTWLLTKPSPSEAFTAIGVIEHMRAHIRDDNAIIHKNMDWAVPLSVAVGIITAAFIPAETAADSARLGVSFGLMGLSAFLSQTLIEMRQKLGYLKGRFSQASQQFSDRQKYLLQRLSWKLGQDQETLVDMINPKKHPVQAGIAALSAVGIAIAPDPMVKMAAFYAGFGAIIFNTVASERHALEKLDGTIQEAQKILGYQKMYDGIMLSGRAPKHDPRFDGE